MTCDGDDITCWLSADGDYDTEAVSFTHTLTGGDQTNFGAGCGKEDIVWFTSSNGNGSTEFRIYT